MQSAPDMPAPVAECLGVKVPDSPFLSPQRIARINAARYEGQEIAGALEIVRPEDRVLELGAGIGVVGAVVALNARPARVLSFEANPDLVQHVEALHRLNGLQDRISLRNEVLISAPTRPATVGFHLRSSYLGSSLIDSDSRPTRRVEVPTAGFAEVKAEFAPTVLLIDIEGGELEFLRHADLRGIRALVIEFHPGVYGKDGMKECKRLIERAGFARVPEHCTRQVWTCRIDPAVIPPEPDRGWATGMETLEGAIVVPPTDSALVQEAGVLHADGSYYPGGALWRNGRALTIPPRAPDGDLPRREGTWLWGGLLWVHFGHFLVESLSRLWAMDHLETEIDGILFAPKRPRNGESVADFQTDILRAAGITAPVAVAARPEKVDRLIVPGQGFGLGPMIGGTADFRGWARSRLGRDIPPSGPEKLYISRSRLPTGRGSLLGEAVLERHLAAAGYSVYHPEKHGIADQIATYKAARRIIAAEGSALHLVAMVAGPDTEVALIVRRPSGATRNLERHLEAFAGRAPVTLTHLARSWKPLGPAKPRTWMGELDLPALGRALRETGFLAPRFADWPPLDPETLRDTLGNRFEEVTDRGGVSAAKAP